MRAACRCSIASCRGSRCTPPLRFLSFGYLLLFLCVLLPRDVACGLCLERGQLFLPELPLFLHTREPIAVGISISWCRAAKWLRGSFRERNGLSNLTFLQFFQSKIASCPSSFLNSASSCPHTVRAVTQDRGLRSQTLPRDLKSRL